jgi:heme-degrading monooxygenase HmoA
VRSVDDDPGYEAMAAQMVDMAAQQRGFLGVEVGSGR